MECRCWARRKGLFPAFKLLMLLLLFVGSHHTVAARNSERYDAAYECEGKTLKIECGEGELIHLIRANYGRYSITICNEHGNTDWSVNCMSTKSYRVLFDRCDQKRNCSIVASTSQFGDPCPNTLKYLEAHYQCMSATTTTTSRPSPPWLTPNQPSVWSTAKPTVRPPSRMTTPPAQSPPPPAPPTPAAFPTTLSPTTIPSKMGGESVDVEPPLVDNGGDQEPGPMPPMISETTQSSPTTWRTSRRPTVPSTMWPETIPNGQWSDYGRHVCMPTQTRNLFWNMTRAGDVAVQTCPGGATGLARWRCVGQGDTAAWYRGTPDLSECRSVWLTVLENRVIEGDVILSISSELSQVTNNSRVLYGGDMMITTKIIRNMAEKMTQNVRAYSDHKQRQVAVKELLLGVIKTGSNLLDKAQLPSWKDLSHQEQMRVATSLLIGLEENAFLLANAFEKENIITQKGENILVSVRILETHNINSDLEIFPGQMTQQQWTVSEDHVELTKGSLLENSENGVVRLVFMAFDRLEEILQPQAETSSVVANDDSQITYNKNATRILNSKVISASLGKGRHIQLSEPVKLYFKHLTVDNVTNPTCVFWDFIMSAWSEEGCHIHVTNSTHTVCKCNHLTNFAVLMDVHAVKLDTAHQVALQIITYVGCIISAICLVLAIVTFHFFRGLKSDRTTIHKNLCVCLLIAEVLFVCGIGQTDQRIVCGVVAGLLHFFFLCAFAWMFLEGFQLYVMLIEVFEAEKSRLRWYYLVAYGAPLLVVAISCIIDPLSYGTDRYCWLRADNYFIFSFVGPVILVIMANLVFLSMAIYMMCRHANTAISMKSKEHSRLASARAWLRGAIVLVFLLGLTWTFGLLYLNQESVVMAYIFTVLNSLQGLFIFVFHCVQNEKVRKEYRKFIRRHSWLPKCLRCSKTVSGNSAGSSGTSGVVANTNGGKEFASHNTSSNPSAPTTDSSGLSPHAAASNISFKSCSRDSGHGGSEQEDSPRTHSTMTLGHGRTRDRRIAGNGEPVEASTRSGRRAASPYNHTYTEIRDGRGIPGQMHSHHGQHVHIPRGLGVAGCEDDPVYEEIERGSEIQVSDMSDEDGRRQSDMSRQSSRSYGDHRPLIPYSPANDRSLIHYGQTIERNLGVQQQQQHCNPELYSPGDRNGTNNCWEKIRRHQARYELGELPRLSGNYGIGGLPPLQPDHSRTVAVLDGHTVVCHLQPQTDLYTGRNMPPPSYSEC